MQDKAIAKDAFASLLSELDEQLIRLSGAVNIVDAIHSALENNSYPIDNWGDAAFAAYLYLDSIRKQMQDSVDIGYQLLKGAINERDTNLRA